MSTVSVIIPTYNRFAVGRAIASVFQQTIGLGNIELIVIDDQSHSLYRDFLKLFENDNSLKKQFIFNESNKGPGFNRNLGLTLSKNEYVIFLDSDDFLAPHALQDMVSCAVSNNSDIIVGKRIFLNGGVPFPNLFSKTRINTSIYDCDVFHTLGPGCKLFRTSLLKDNFIRYVENRNYGEDQPFVAKAYLKANSISILSDKFYLYLEQDELSLTSNFENLDNILQTAIDVLSVIDKYADNKKNLANLKARCFSEVALAIMNIANGGNVRADHLELLIDILNTHYCSEIAAKLHPKQNELIEAFTAMINNRGLN
jgi:poly(ribitol-phosphate) beta-N-acetylglucosaminyltransferase